MKPDFERNVHRILKGERPERATLFELFIDTAVCKKTVGHDFEDDTPLSVIKLRSEAMHALGYDFATCYASGVRFPPQGTARKQTASLNAGAHITDWESFEAFKWPDMRVTDRDALLRAREFLPEGMKLIILGPGGVLENAIDLVGYDNLCFMLYEEPELVKCICDRIGAGLIDYYEAVADLDVVGALCYNDDWGFNTQTLISPPHLREYVFPWAKRIVELGHRNGKPCVLHSCGHYESIIEDIIGDMHFDARHSYEDNIVPVEQAYEALQGKIAVVGGIDVNFLCQKTPEEILARSLAMLQRTAERGGYALGSGNSIAQYVPTESLNAMRKAVEIFGRG